MGWKRAAFIAALAGAEMGGRYGTQSLRYRA